MYLPASNAVDSESVAQVLRRFRVIFNAVRSHFRQVEKQVGLGGAQVWALSVVHARPGIGIGELAQCMDIHQSTASNLVRGLLSKSLITQTRGALDKRHVHLHTTAAADGVLDKAPAPFEGVLPAALAQLPTATLAQLDVNLAELMRLLQADQQAANIPLADL
ncbi:MAG: hypothetical protein Fur007_03360 [Rhodoferax sp.]